MIFKKNNRPSDSEQKINHKRNLENDMFFESTTKVFVTSSLFLSWVCILMSYLLCFMSKESTAIALSKNIANILLGTLLPYLLKSFFETYCSEKNRKEVAMLKLKYKLSDMESDSDIFEELNICADLDEDEE